MPEQKSLNPNKPNTTDGTPARLEIFIRIKSFNLFFVAYSSKINCCPNSKIIDTGATTHINQIEPTNAALIPAFSGTRDPKFWKNSGVK